MYLICLLFIYWATPLQSLYYWQSQALCGLISCTWEFEDYFQLCNRFKNLFLNKKKKSTNNELEQSDPFEPFVQLTFASQESVLLLFSQMQCISALKNQHSFRGPWKPSTTLTFITAATALALHQLAETQLEKNRKG